MGLTVKPSLSCKAEIQAKSIKAAESIWTETQQICRSVNERGGGLVVLNQRRAKPRDRQRSSLCLDTFGRLNKVAQVRTHLSGRGSGQVVVEYVLLLVVVVSLAFFVTKQLVSRSVDEPGIITQKWCKILEGIGQDLPEEPPAGAAPGGSICP